MTEIINRLNKRIKECEVRYGRGLDVQIGYTDDARLLIEARDTIIADMSELGRLRQDNLRLVESLARAQSR